MIYEALPRRVGRIWGALADPAGRPVGEIYWVYHDDGGSAGLVGADGSRTSVEELCSSGSLPVRNGRYPLLVKTLHPARKLSVQVHPGREGGPRKDETWLVLEADPGAWMMGGLAPGVDRHGLEAAIRQGRAEEALQRMPLKAGDTVHLPAGSVHSLGGGVEVLEIQSNTDITYRLYDYNRLGSDGRPRPLHLEKGLQAVDYARRGAPDTRGEWERLEDLEAPYALRRVREGAGLAAGETLFLTDGRMELPGGRGLEARSCVLAAGDGGRVELEGEGVIASPRTGLEQDYV
ncbi:MAG: class I mannose-6-phosphate isomerase [Candidatus Fermentibacteraceae bacterium]